LKSYIYINLSLYIYIYIYDRDDFHWLSTYNDIYKNPKYKDRGNNIYTIVEDSYTRGIKQIWDPSLHEKDVIYSII